MRRRWTTIVLAGALALSSGALPATAQSVDEGLCPADTPRAPFADVPDDATHADGIDCAYANELISGVSADRFAPGQSVSRQQAATLVARALDAAGVTLPAASAGTDFADVSDAHRDNVRRLQAAGIVSGRSDGSYGTGDVTREQFASLMVRALSYARNLDILAATSGAFSDVSGTAHAANVEAAAEQGLLSGRADGTFAPTAATRRDQAASVATRLLGELERGGDFQTAGDEIWALDQGTDRIHVYDGDNAFAVKATIDVRPATLRADGFDEAPAGARTVPHMIEFDSEFRYAFIASTVGGVTIVVDARSKEVVEVLATGPGTHMADVTPDDSALWISVIGTAGRADTTADGAPAADRKLVEVPLNLDAASPTFAIGRELHVKDLVAPIEAANDWEYPSYSAVCHQFSPDSKLAWITLGPSWNQGGLIVLDLASGTLVEEAAYDPTVVKANCGLSVTEDVVLANWSGRVEADNDSDGEWYVIDPDTYEVLETRSAEGFDAHGLRITPDGKSYWQVNRISNNALVIDAETLEVTARIDNIGDTPDILDYSRDGSLVYVTQRGPTPQSGGIHAAAGQQPGVAVVEAATGRRLGVITQDAVRGSEGQLLNDVHGIGVRPASDQDTASESASIQLANFDPRPAAVLGFHCSLPSA